MPTARHWISVKRQRQRRTVFSPGLVIPAETAVYRLERFFDTHDECVAWMRVNFHDIPDATTDLA